MDPHVAIIRIFLSMALGALIGLEREMTQKSAGLRTHILVTLGATIFTLVSLADFYHGLPNMPFSPEDDNRIVRDPSRVAAQIVAGIGFIGGGAVLRYGTTVRGLTTAASLWTMASIGMLVGIGYYYLSLIATLVTFLVLFTIGKFERHFFSKHIRTFNRLRVSIVTRSLEASHAQAWMEDRYSKEMVEAKMRTDTQADKAELSYVLHVVHGKVNVQDISRHLPHLPGVISSTVKSYHESEDSS